MRKLKLTLEGGIGSKLECSVGLGDLWERPRGRSARRRTDPSVSGQGAYGVLGVGSSPEQTRE